MTTVSTKHVPTPGGDPALSIHGAKGTILDDMELIRKYCMPEKLNQAHRNASSVAFGQAPTGPLQTTKQMDFGQPSMADVEPKDTRDQRSRYMNTKHFDLGSDAPPMMTQSQASYAAPPRGYLTGPQKANPYDKNASNMFMSDQDKADWLKGLKSSNQNDFTEHPAQAQGMSDEMTKNLRGHHFDFGSDPVDYTSHNKDAFDAVAAMAPERTEPVKARPSAVQFGQSDYNWGADLKTTNKEAFQVPETDDSLTEFAKQGPPLSFGDDPREMMTTNKQSYKNVGYLDCAALTDEQLLMLGVTREQLIPRKVNLPFLSSQVYKNSMGQPIAN